MLWAGLAMQAGRGLTAIPDAFLRPLENRYPVPTPQVMVCHAGLIVLEGVTGHPDLFLAHARVPLGEAAERMSVPVSLMRQHPKLELVFSGGEGRLLPAILRHNWRAPSMKSKAWTWPE